MKAVSGKEFARVLERHGWSSLRVVGSHHVYGKAGNPARIAGAHPWQRATEDRLAETPAQQGEINGR